MSDSLNGGALLGEGLEGRTNCAWLLFFNIAEAVAESAGVLPELAFEDDGFMNMTFSS